ncbi:MAG: serine/threonine protein kinase, partial [Lentisphaeria bacterium]|nr:serine/threonine protein kinase [Lentisphaeria bacterium]
MENQDESKQSGSHKPWEFPELNTNLKNFIDTLKEPENPADDLPDYLTRHYEDIDALGHGGSAEVMASYDGVLQRTIAKKVMHEKYAENPKHIKRFIREAQLMARLSHPNIIPIYELGKNYDGQLQTIMKLVSGKTLSHVIRKIELKEQQYLEEYTLRKRIDIFLRVCDAISYAHDQGVIHRDIKPGNIIVGDFGEVMLLDWGLAKYIPNMDTTQIESTITDITSYVTDELCNDHTKMGTVSGTPNYMSPEQAEGYNHKMDGRSDIYALGALLFEMLVLKQLYPRQDALDILNKVINEPVKLPKKNRHGEKIDAELVAICEKAMEKEPNNRYQTVKELSDDLQAYLDFQPISVYEAPLYKRFANMCMRNPVPTASISVFLICILTLATVRYARFTNYFNNAVNSYDTANEQFLDWTKVDTALYKINSRVLTKKRSSVEQELIQQEQQLRHQHNLNKQVFYQSLFNAYTLNPMKRNKLEDLLLEFFKFRIHYAKNASNKKVAHSLLEDLNKSNKLFPYVSNHFLEGNREDLNEWLSGPVKIKFRIAINTTALLYNADKPSSPESI